MNKILYVLVIVVVLFAGCTKNDGISSGNKVSQADVSWREDSATAEDEAVNNEQQEEKSLQEQEQAADKGPSEEPEASTSNEPEKIIKPEESGTKTARGEKNNTIKVDQDKQQKATTPETVEKPEAEQKDIEKLKINENSESTKMYVTAKSLNMRAYMSTEDSNVIKTLPKGTEVTRVAQKEDWSKILLQGGTEGYVKSKHLSSEKPVETVITSNETHWKYEREGLKIEINKYKEYLEGGNVVYWVAEIKSNNINRDINTAFAGGSYLASVKTKQKTSTIAKNNNAILAINGDASGFRPASNAFHNPVMIRNGKVEYDLIVGKSIGKMGALTNQGKLVIFDPKDYTSTQQMLDEGFTDTWWFDVALVINGQVQNIYDGNQSKYKNPYSAIGQRADGTMLFITVDGRGSNGSAGLNYGGMARLMGRYGAYNAYQLDGGGSATMVFDGKVLNKPSDGGERAISDIIFVGR